MQDHDQQEVLEAIHALASHMDVRFEALEAEMKSEIGTLKSDVGSLKSDVGTLKSDVGSLKKDVASMKALMVTKDYLDDKLGDLRGDMVLMMRKEDGKVERVIQKLRDKEVFNEADVKELTSVSLFPRVSL